MKKKFKAFISCLLAVLMLVPTTVAFAATPTSENEQLAKNIRNVSFPFLAQSSNNDFVK